MKQTSFDVLVCALALGLISAATLALTGLMLLPWFRSWFGEFHPLAILVATLLVYGVLSAFAVRSLLLIHPLRPGRYAMDSSVFTYWKLLTVIVLMARWALRPFTVALTMPIIVWLFGARIGRNVAIGGEVDEPYLLTLGDGAVLGNGSFVAGSVISDGFISLGAVTIGAGATVGVNAVILAGSSLGEHAILAGGSIAIPGSIIPAGESWRGNPARKWMAAAKPESSAVP